MTTAAVVFFTLAGATAVVDWWAVAGRRRSLEYVAKPSVMVWLIGAAISIDSGVGSATRWMFVLALVFGLAGDIFLMLERERFLAGLAAFFLCHVAYTAGLGATSRLTAGGLAAGAAIVTVAGLVLGPRIVRSVRTSHPDLLAPVVGYIVIISAMVAAAFGTAVPLAAAGASLFYTSDATLAWNRFVAPHRLAPLAVIVLYHGGQSLLVASLVAI